MFNVDEFLGLRCGVCVVRTGVLELLLGLITCVKGLLGFQIVE